MWCGVASTYSSGAMYSIAARGRSDRGCELDALAFALGADVGEVLLLGRVDRHVIGARILADDHALVDFVAGADEELAALAEVIEGVGGGHAGVGGDEGAGDAGLQLTDVRARTP
jgi:hypothetical protein